jgi:hypothetical protein
VRAAKAIFHSPQVFAGVSILCASLAYISRGQNAATGFLFGWFATLFCMVVLWLVIGILARSALNEQPPPGAAWIIAAFFIKLPVFVMSAKMVNAMGGQAPTFFLLGLGLVYSWLIGWALAKS